MEPTLVAAEGSDTISPDFPYESRYVDVEGSRMHYVEEGGGRPILFLHGNPTSSYLWRNVLPHVRDQGRCIAVDLIGMGRSDKPDIDYHFQDHARYLDGFIEALGLNDVTLVLHDWGSGLGFHYAHRNPENVRAIAFMESVVRPLSSDFAPLGVRIPLRLMRTPFVGGFIASVANVMLNKMLPDLILRTLTPEERAHYRAPYPTVRSRKPLRRWPEMIPLDGKPAEMQAVFEGFSRWLQESPVPKLMLTVEPGIAMKAEDAQWALEHLPNLQHVHLGAGLHFIQEDHPHAIGKALARWCARLG